MQQLIFGRRQGNTIFGATGINALNQYGTLGTSARFAPASGSNNFLEWPISAAGTFSKVQITLKASPASSLPSIGSPPVEKKLRFRLYVNGSLAFTIQVTENETAGTYEGTPISVAAGDRLKWECIPGRHADRRA